MRRLLVSATLMLGLTACGDDDVTLDRCSTTAECSVTEMCINGFCTPTTDVDSGTDAGTDAGADAGDDAAEADVGVDAPGDADISRDDASVDGDVSDAPVTCADLSGMYNVCDDGDRCIAPVCYAATATITQDGCTLTFRTGSRDGYFIGGSATLSDGIVTLDSDFVASRGGSELACTQGQTSRGGIVFECGRCGFSLTPVLVPET